jgi:3-hydroxymyristoyl/3-hydroxydecanoyl-(acyl carrier protein) dehydratase
MTASHLDSQQALAFDGEPFDALVWSAKVKPSPTVPLAPEASRGAAPARATRPAGGQASRLLREVRADLVKAHLSAMSVQTVLQRRSLAALSRRGSTNMPRPPQPDTAVAPTARAYTVTVRYSEQQGVTIGGAVPSRQPRGDQPAPAPTIEQFKGLARTAVSTLDEPMLASLARGEIAAAFGSAYDQDGCNPSIRLAEGANGALTGISGIARHQGSWNRGQLHGTCRVNGDPMAAAVEVSWQAAQVFAMYVGMHLCLSGAHFEVAANGDCEVEVHPDLSPGASELTLDVVDVDLLPRPRLRVSVELRQAGTAVATVRDLALEIKEAPGTPIAPEAGGIVPRFFGRKNAFGDRALLNEFHMTHSARGDLGIALGPEFSRYADRRATRMPNHGLQLCDRVMAVDGERGRFADGASGWTEYDSFADCWYYAETANASMPNVIYMETSLQSALLLGYFLGATLTDTDEDYSLRNLDGHATVLREVDLRDKTIQQRSRLLTTTVLTGAVLQNFSYELSVDGEPFYAGESLFGFFNAQALANQNGLDNGDYVAPWLDGQSSLSSVRTIDVAGRRATATGGLRCSNGHLALLDSVDVVDGGGKYGKGYLRAVRPVREDDWFFRYHFYLDPVMPGSLGVEAVIQAIQEWVVDTGLAAELAEPEFVLPTNLATSWRYRGQILATDREMTLDVHIKDVQRRAGRVRVVGEANVWKPGLRIYELGDIAVEVREADSQPW